jgi:hypothetical protein
MLHTRRMRRTQKALVDRAMTAGTEPPAHFTQTIADVEATAYI